MQGAVSQVASGANVTLTNGTGLSAGLHSLSNAGRAALQTAHAKGHAAGLTVGMEEMDLVFDMVRRHASGGTGLFDAAPVAVARAFAAPDPDGEAASERAWIDMAHAWGSIDGKGDLGGYRYALSGLAAGYDLLQRTHATAGVWLGFGAPRSTAMTAPATGSTPTASTSAPTARSGAAADGASAARRQ